MKDFLNKYMNFIFLGFAIIVLFKSCGDSREYKKIDDQLQQVNSELDSIKSHTYSKEEWDVRMEIVGLKSEKRMIQSTSRKMIDVQRQNTIEEEIIRLEKELK